MTVFLLSVYQEGKITYDNGYSKQLVTDKRYDDLISGSYRSELPLIEYDEFSLALQYGEKPSFTTLVKERFLSDILAEIRFYSKFHDVPVKPIALQKVIVTNFDLEENRLYFDVLYTCDIKEQEKEIRDTLVVDCYFDLASGFQGLHTRCSTRIWKEFTAKQTLPDDLVPVIPKKELDLIASRIVSKLYPRASDHAVPICVEHIAQKLNLRILDIPFDQDQNIFGKIFFEDAHTVIPDPETGILTIYPADAGTIFVNKPVNGILDMNVRNNTIVHECVHWLLHRPAFLLAKAWNQGAPAIACRRSSYAVPHREWTAIDRMEWQANTLAPRILMQAWATRFIADTQMHHYRRLSPLLRMEKTIDDLSRHFGVSRQLAKIRVEELGYEDAKEAFTYYERKKHTISFENAVREIARNKAFRDTLATGIYLYADNSFVIRDRKYVQRDDDGVLHLTPYAKSHPDQCCLSFVSRRINRGMQYGMLRDKAEDEMFVSGSNISLEQLSRTAKRVYEIRNSLPHSFGETLVEHMKRKGITVERLSEDSLVSLKQLQRYRNEMNPVIPMNKAVALCIGLKLHPVLAMDLINKAGLAFNATFIHTAYYSLLLSMTNRSIYECNALLKSIGVPLLGKE